MGRSGFSGEIDTHFWDRFGGAMLMSVLEASATEASSSIGPVIVAPSQAAAVALENASDIPASLRKAPGEEVTIFTASDLDFSGVYRLEAR